MNFVAALGCLVRQFVRATSLAMAVLAVLSFTFSQQAKAQQGDGTIGWVSNAYSNPSGPFSTAYEACQAQWKYWMNNGYSRFIGAQQHSDNWTVADCQWTQYQYLCPQETGGGLACGTIWPSGATFQCESGYTPIADGHCRLNPAPECPTCAAGRDNPTVGNPIILSTGAKILQSQDYVTADGLFEVGRYYRSFQVGRPIAGKMLPRSQPRGLIGGWNFNFGHEIQLGTFSGTPASPSAEVAVLLPDGTGYGFILQSNGQWTMDPAIGAGNVRNDLKLQFIGALPSDLSTLQASASTWQFTDQDDNVWTLQTRVGPNGSLYNTGWVTQKVTRSGYTQTFAYNSDSSLASITDSFGRIASLSWNQYYSTTLATPVAGTLPYPLSVASITLPDNTLVRYTYSPAPALSAPSTSMIKQLVKVERVGATGTVVDSTYASDSGRLVDAHPVWI